ncbi:cadherin-15 [Myripristis murdjan]|uniref:cadherin-15 n=1 Tax=Myripristis murdjan TaxID=586833 RepID=UPI001176375F|nr:cadherin-15 [Myripristis murdjan]
MAVRMVVVLCVLGTLLCQVWSSSETQLKEEKLLSKVLYPWKRQSNGLVRVKRDWIIPPIRVLENSKQVPEDLVQIKSDKIFTGEVIYKLEGPGVDQEPKNLFEIDDKTGVIRSKQPLDREKYSSFTLKAFALSPSGERLENPTTIEIVVLDQNDNRPTFTQNQFIGAVSEFSVPGTSVMSVSATDADDSMTDNAVLSYSIIGQESIPANAVTKTMFGINNQTGAIYTRDVGLDREVVKSFRLKLQVADMSGMGLTSEGVAIIHVSDINNHAPQFNPNMYSMTGVENKKDYEIGRVNVTDRDDRGTGNWRAKYSIAKGDPHGSFAISTDNVTNQGILTVVKPLDYEAQPEYNLILTVENLNALSNKAPNNPVSSATVVITVGNENEAPRFREDPIRIVVPESVVPGTVLKRNIAYDPDYSELRYEITRDPEKWLDINRETGDISVKRAFNIRSPHIRNNIYNAIVKVTDAGGVSSSASLAITLKETNDFPPQLFPLSGTVCREAERMTSELILTAVDEDRPPHAEPFTFELPDDLSINWTIIQVNETHAVLQPLVEMEAGEYTVTVLVSDSGSPTLSAYAQVNVTVCPCDSFGDCKSDAAAILGSSVGISLIALIIIMASIALLLLLLLLAVAVSTCRRRHHIKKGTGLLVGESEDDIRDNVLNYDEQGGGEEDENAFNIDLLWNPHDAPPTPGSFCPVSSIPRGKQPLRRDAPHNLPSPTYPRRPPADPTDIEDYINDGLEAADQDPNVPPYDTALIYDYEGEGSLAGSLSSIASGSSDGDQDYDYLNDWGPRFKKLANMYDPR